MRALVVDESSVIRRFIGFILKEFRDLQITEASDGVQAHKLLTEEAFDIVILDVNLPQMDGLTLLEKRFGAGGPNAATPIVMLSTRCDEKTVARAKDLGAREFLAKPVPAVKVRDVVRQMLSMPSMAAPGDKRRTPRLQVPISVRFEGEQPMDRKTSDISPFGAFIVSETWKPAGTEAEITLTLPHLAAPLRVRCRVVHVRPQPLGHLPQGFGVRFITDNPEDLSQLVRAFTSPEDGQG
jgi:two-component system chemotaxis response regulator CheY